MRAVPMTANKHQTVADRVEIRTCGSFSLYRLVTWASAGLGSDGDRMCRVTDQIVEREAHMSMRYRSQS
jgi:hypothetical protein